MTLKISDLSVGDWVKVILSKCDYDESDTVNAKVLWIEGNSVGVGYDNSGILMSALVEDLQPIPITPEILAENGFQYNKKVFADTWCWTNEKDTIIEEGMFKDDAYLRIVQLVDGLQRDSRLSVKQVHQLQRALRLTGVEKEIIIPKK